MLPLSLELGWRITVRNIFALLLCVSILSACNPSQPSLTSPIAVMNTANPIVYTEPSDHKLTAAQINIYISTKRKMLDLSNRLRNANGDFEIDHKLIKTAELQRQILLQSGMSATEFHWVQEKIIETTTRLMLSEVYALHADIIQKLAGVLEFTEARLAKISEPEERRQQWKANIRPNREC